MSTYSGYSSTLSSPRLSSYTPRQYSGSNYSSSSSYLYKPPLSSTSYRSTVPTYLGSSSYSSAGTRRSSTGNYYTSTFSNTNTLGSSYLSNSSSTSNLSSNYLKSSSNVNKLGSSYLTSPSGVSTIGSSYIGSRSLGSSYYSTIKNELPIRRNSTLDSISSKSSYETTGEIKTSLSCGKSEEPKQKVGLKNLGNTCYMNSVLQCLCHTQPLVDYLIRGSYKSDINYSSPTKGKLVKVFAELIENMKQSRNAISPNHLLSEYLSIAPNFRGNKQEDAQEFLMIFMQGLHEDIKRSKYKPSKREYCGNSWSKYQDLDDSLIVDLFAGQLKSTLQCTICKNESFSYDPFWDLSLPIPEGCSSVSLRQCFTAFSKEEILDEQNKAYCEKCKKQNRSSKKFEVHKFPKVLVIHLKRLSSSGCALKNSTKVDYPFTLKNLSEFSSRNCLRDYELYAVVEHFGSSCGGHYVAICKNLSSKDKDWYTFNDSSVSKTNNVITNKSYMLFLYTNIKF